MRDLTTTHSRHVRKTQCWQKGAHSTGLAGSRSVLYSRARNMAMGLYQMKQKNTSRTWSQP